MKLVSTFIDWDFIIFWDIKADINDGYLSFLNPRFSPQGHGVSTSPYLISNWKELYWVSMNPSSWNLYFKQTADIDFLQATPEISTWNSGAGWRPIGNSTNNFSGNYDGDGYIINGIYCKYSVSNIGVFGISAASGIITNLGVTNVDITGYSVVGALIGRNAGVISNCFSSGTVKATDSFGGFVGYVLSAGKISNCFSRANVIRTSGSGTYTGGFVGNVNQGKIDGCYSTGSIEYLNSTSPTNKGFVGYVTTGGNFSMKNNYWDKISSRQTSSYSTYAVGRTSNEMKVQATFINWDFNTVWMLHLGVNDGYPAFISTKSYNNEGLKLGNVSIDDFIMSSNSIMIFGQLLSIGSQTTDAKCGFLLHTSSTMSVENGFFTEKLDLGNFSSPSAISGKLYNLKNNSNYYICAFVVNEKGISYSIPKEITTLIVESVIPQGDGTDTVPFLISNWQELYCISQNPVIWNKCYKQIADIDFSIASPDITTWDNGTGWNPIGSYTTKFSGSYDGGGYVINGIYCNASTNLGLFGYSSSTSIIKNVGVTNVFILGTYNVGSLIGNNCGTISSSFSSGLVYGNSEVGGLVGLLDYSGDINNCYSRVNVTRLTGTSTIFGGFVGYAKYGKITNCYSTGKVEYEGIIPPTDRGFHGIIYSTSISNCYWDITSSKLSTTIVYNAKGKTTNEMKIQSTYVDWDFTDIWTINPLYNGGYPCFKKNIQNSLILNRPEISNVNVFNILNNSVSVSGLIESTGTNSLFSYGVLINTKQNISLEAGEHIINHNLGQSSTIGEFSTNIDGLSNNTVYYVCTYATNENGTFYSSPNRFKTKEQDSQVPQGSGTIEAPYLISNWKELYWVSQTTPVWGMNFLQTADIDFSQADPTISTWDAGAGWTPIGNNTISFSGTYNGNGYLINGVYCNRNTTSFQGLFGFTSSTSVISNLGLTNYEINGSNYVGSLVGYNAGAISNCYTSGIVKGTAYLGGFIGFQESTGGVSNCFSRSNISRISGTSTYIGGFVGYVNSGKVDFCYSTGKVEYLGVTSPTNKGFVGSLTTGGTFSMTNNYWDNTASGQSSTGGDYATAKITDEMKTQFTFINWDFSTVWLLHLGVNDGYPTFLGSKNNNEGLELGNISIESYLFSNSSIKISGLLLSVGSHATSATSGFLVHTSPVMSIEDGTYTAKLDLGSFYSPSSIFGEINNLANNTTYYLRAYVINNIGICYTEPKQFKTHEQESFIPQGSGTEASPYLISNWQELYWISQNTSSWNKHFKQTADIDLHLTTPAVSTWNSGGGWTPIGNYSVPFSGSYDGGGYVINELYCNRSSADNQGLFGRTSSTSVIKNVGVTNVNIIGNYYVGSLIGYNGGAISNCFSSGLVNGCYSTGGFVGQVNSTGVVLNCFSRTKVISSFAYSNDLGGFVGNVSQGKVDNCYSTGKVEDARTTSLTSKGFVSYAYSGGNFSMTNNYWDITSSGQTTSYGTNATGKTTADMKLQATYPNWDFINIWTINSLNNEGYPCFKQSIQNSSFIKRPEIDVVAYSNITSSSMDISGIIRSNSANSLFSYGVVVNTEPTVSLESGKNILSINLGQRSTVGEFSTSLADLEKNTAYYVCVYATNEYGAYYSEVKKIHTYPIDPQTPSGSGNSESDPYLISKLSELFWFNIMVNENGNDFTGKYFKQVNDINASGLNQWKWNNVEGEGWMPVGLKMDGEVFNGNYNGSGKTISHIKINCLDKTLYRIVQDTIGMSDSLMSISFWSKTGLNSIISDMVIDNIVVSSQYDNYSIYKPSTLFVGVCQGEINKCIVSGINSGYYMSGFVYENRGIIKECSVSGTLNSKDSRDDASFCNYNKGTISSCKTNITFIGNFYDFCERNTGTITNCYSINNANNLYSFVNYGSGTIKNCYSLKTGSFSGGVTATNFWDTEVSGKTSGTGATGKTTAEMKTASTFLNAGWDFLGETANGTDDIWVIHPAYNNGYPFLVWEAPNLTYLGGTVYYDRDKSNSQNNGDYPIVGMKVELLPEGTITETIHDGSFAFFAEPGEHTYRVLPAAPYYQGGDVLERTVTVKLLEDMVVPSIGVYGNDIFDFSLTSATVWSRCGRTTPTWVVVQNRGNLPASVDLEFKPDSHVSFVSSSPAVTSTGTGGEKVYRLENMLPSEQRSVEIQLQLPVAFMDTVKHVSTLKYNSSVIETNTLKNLIRCSYDPNDISVFPAGLTENGYVGMEQELTYLIRFQNTGNDTAFIVDVRTTLDENLDPLSFKLLAASHEMRYFLEKDGAVRFYFDNINLLDSTSNEPESHGFVLYSIKPKATITSGAIANAQANIYFDYNPAIVTNTTTTTFIEDSDIIAQSIQLEQGWNLISFYVNPLDSTVSGVFSDNLDNVEEIKSDDAFYRQNQQLWLNSLKKINGGEAFLIKLKQPMSLSVEGTPVFTPKTFSFKKGWNMIGCPIQTSRNFTDQLQGTSTTVVKDFEGFWKPNDPTSSIIKFEPGKGYYIYFDEDTDLEW
ncbi:MAG: hypothetical protein IPO21_00260 [Bacteroidales bacterium]|nr:hypothetical protein [Bacteroidales bacterium]